MSTILEQSQTTLSEGPQNMTDLIAAKLESAVPVSTHRVYRDLQAGQFGCEGYCQGDVMPQYLGQSLPDNLRTAMQGVGNFIEVEVGTTGHMLLSLDSGGLDVFKPVMSHPLIPMFVYTRGGFTIRHGEHAYATFEQTGWFALRLQRDGMLREEELARSLVPARD